MPFWDQDLLNLCGIEDRYGMLSQQTGQRERHEAIRRESDSPSLGLVHEHAPREIADVIKPLVDNPQLIADELPTSAHPVIHGDLRLGNAGFDGDRLALIVWGDRTGSLRRPSTSLAMGGRMAGMETYAPSPTRYDEMRYRRVGRSGLDLPAVSLGLWHNFGDDSPFDRQRAILRTAFDLGVTHFDLANNYGPPYGSSEENFGRHLRRDFRELRDELVISTKAGWDMWPGPYGQIGGSRKYLIASLDQSLQRMGLDYVDIYYHHRPDPLTPLEETMGALHSIVQAGKALYVGISSYSPQLTKRASAILQDLGTPLLIHQPSYSLLNRWVESEGLLDTLTEVGAGCIAFSPLAQGMLTEKYLSGGIPEGSRAAQSKSLSPDLLGEEALSHVRALNDLARQRGQTLAQMALAWVLRRPEVSSVLVGASRPEQLSDNVGALKRLDFTEDELTIIDRHAVDSGIDLWGGARREGDDVRT